MDEGAFVEVFEGVDGVFHMASPFPMAAPEDPEADLIAPAVKGAESAIRAAAATKKPIKRVVLTSSTAAVRIKKVRFRFRAIIGVTRVRSWSRLLNPQLLLLRRSATIDGDQCVQKSRGAKTGLCILENRRDWTPFKPFTGSF